MSTQEEGDSKERRAMITDIVRRWQRKHPDKMHVFAEQVKRQRQGKPYENQGEIYRLSLPREVMEQIEFVTGKEKETRFLNSKKERDWFVSEFPEFVIPYDDSIQTGD